MTKHEIIKYSVFAVIGIAVIILSVSLITAFKNKGDNHYKEIIEAKDETIKAVEGQRDIYKQRVMEINVELEQHFKNDSILVTKSKQLTIKYEKIPVYINSLDREGLRAAVHNY